MAKVTLDPMIKSIRGKVGDVVFRTSPSGKVFVSKAPDMSNVEWSPAQKENRQRMKRAIAYAQAAMADPELRAVYEQRAAAQDRQPFRVAVSDSLKGIDLLAGRE